VKNAQVTQGMAYDSHYAISGVGTICCDSYWPKTQKLMVYSLSTVENYINGASFITFSDLMSSFSDLFLKHLISTKGLSDEQHEDLCGGVNH